MLKQTVFSAAGVVLMMSFSALAQQHSVAVMGLKASGDVDQAMVRSMEDLLSNEIRAMGGLRVISRSDIIGLLNLEKQKRLMGCANDQCLAEIGGALGVDWMLTGTISDFGDTILVNLKLLDVRDVRVIASSSRKATGGKSGLVDVLPTMIKELFVGRAGGQRAVSLEELEARRSRITWGHVLFWSGAGLAVVGGLSLGMSMKRGKDWDSSGDTADRDASIAWEGAMWASFGVSVALMTAGVVFWTWEWEKSDHISKQVSFCPVPGGAVVGLAGHW